MKEKVYVFGHRNPDTDSICSAIAYANLKTLTDNQYEFEAAALGAPNRETQFVLDRLGLPAPKVIEHLRPQVSDLHLDPVEYVYEHTSIKDTLEKVVEQTVRTLPVAGPYNNLIGVVSISDLLPMYMYKDQQDFLMTAKTPFSNLIDALPIQRIHGKEASGLVEGRIILFDDLLPGERLTENDIVFCNVATYTSGMLSDYNPGYLIMGNQRDSEVKIFDGEEATIYSTDKSVYSLIRLIHKTVPISSVVRKSDMVYFATYETLEDVRENMATSKFRSFPVVDELGHIVGTMSRSNLLNANHKKAILVDHNEKGQSIAGVEDVTILEVIDHHRVADIQTIGPLYFRVEPVGCTSTIVANMYLEKGATIDRTMAQLMLSAILSDTLIFKSPTCTDLDKATAEVLADIAKLDPVNYGRAMIYAGADLGTATPASILNSDMKRFVFGNKKVIIAQTNTSDFDGFFSMFDDVLKEMNNLVEQEAAKLVVLLVTDVIIGGTELVAVGKDKWIAEQAFDMDQSDNSIFLPGVFSRKKQVVPKLMQAARL